MDIKKTKQDIVVMAVIMIVSALFYFSFIPGEIRLSSAWNGNTSFSSRTFPYVLAVGMFLVSGIGLAKALVSFAKLKKSSEPENTNNQTENDKTRIMDKAVPFIIYALILVYIVLLGKIGFILSTLVIPPLMIFILGCRKWQYYLAVYVFAAVVYVIFTTVLKIPVP